MPLDAGDGRAAALDERDDRHRSDPGPGTRDPGDQDPPVLGVHRARARRRGRGRFARAGRCRALRARRRRPVPRTGGRRLPLFPRHAFHTDAADAHTKIFAGWRPLFVGSLLKPEHTVSAGLACLAADAAIAAYFLAVVGPEILWFALAGGLVAVLFTPLMRRGLKEPTIFVTFGPLCVCGTTFALAGRVGMAAVAASIPVGLFITAVAYLKSARFDLVDRDGDQVVLKVRRTAIVALLAGGYLALVAGVALGRLPLLSLVGFLSMPLAFSVTSVVRGAQSRVTDYLWATVRAILISVVAGVAIAVAMLVG